MRIIANPLPSEQTTMAPGKSLQDEKKTNDPRRNVTWFLGSSWAHQCITDYLKLCSSDRHQKSFLASLFRLNLAASNSLLTLSASASAASELFPKCWSFSCHLVSLRPETLQIWRPESSRCNAAMVLSPTQKTRIWHGALISWELLLFLQHVRTREYRDAWTDWLVDSPWSCKWCKNLWLPRNLCGENHAEDVLHCLIGSNFEFPVDLIAFISPSQLSDIFGRFWPHMEMDQQALYNMCGRWTAIYGALRCSRGYQRLSYSHMLSSGSVDSVCSETGIPSHLLPAKLWHIGFVRGIGFQACSRRLIQTSWSWLQFC